MTSPQGPADQQTVRRHNLSLITAAISTAAGSRAELAQRTGLTKATVSSLVDALLAQGLVVEGDPPASRIGRPARPVSLNPAGPPALGLEINVDYVAGCVLDLTGQVRDHRQISVDNRGRSVLQILDDVTAVATSLAPSHGSIAGAALAVPGVVGAGQQLLRVPNLPHLTGQPVADQLAARLGVRQVLVDNEANFGALASVHGSDSGADLVYVSGEIGVGAGLVVGGALFRGASGYAGELGHVVVERDGPPCGCGGRGCVEQYAGQDVLLRTSGRADLGELAAAVAAGDQRACAAVAAAGAALGVGLASLLNVMDLPRVVLGGVYARLFEAMLPALRAELDQRVLSGAGTAIERSGIGAEAAVLGAAQAVLERALREPADLVAISAGI